MKKGNLNDIFGELKLEYLNGMDEKISNIHKFWEGNNAYELEQEFHKMKGTGATYGLQEVSVISEIMEGLCKANSPQLGYALLLSVELLKKVKNCHLEENNDWELPQDPVFLKLNHLSQNHTIAA